MSNNPMQLQFLPNEGDEDEGLADAGIETFRDAPFSSVARESGQNSRDASVDFPVSISFDLVEIGITEFPDIGVFENSIKQCAKRANEREDKKEIQFFEKAEKLLSKERIFALKISDENTTGLIGPCEPGTPFHSLVKASGVSNKNDVTSGGSFGIGKKAAFAVSDIHTVFYSTLYKDAAGESVFLAQGKCTLVSHLDAQGIKRRATGYWGRPGYLPITSIEEVPGWLSRTSVGTTTTAVGFPASADWMYKIAESLVRNFFAAIHRDELWFFVDDAKLEIDSTSLEKIMGMREIEVAADDHGTREDLDFSKVLYECLTSVLAKPFEVEIQNLGSFKLHLLLREGLPKRVAIIRNGMVITDNLSAFGDKLVHFPMYKDFVAIVEPTDTLSKSILKRLENPRHDQLSVERLISIEEQKTIRSAMTKLKSWIRDCIRSEAYIKPAEETVLEEMNEFFGDIGNADRIPDPDLGEADPFSIVYKPIKRSPSRAGRRGQQKDGDGGAGGANDGSGGSRPGSGSGRGDTVGGSGGGDELDYQDFRNTADSSRPARVRNIYFTPVNTCTASADIYVKGMSDDVPIGRIVLKDDSGMAVKALTLVAGERVHATVELSSDYLGPISMKLTRLREVDANEAQ